MLIDAHCHLHRLDSTSFGGNIAEAYENAKKAGIMGCLIPAVVRAEWPEIINITKQFEHLYGAIAVHPSELNEPLLTLDELLKYGASDQIVAIGETGLDFTNETSEEEKLRQKQLLELHIQASLMLHKPLIIHVRNAWPELLSILYRFPVDKVGGMIHCFTGDYQMAKAVLDLGWYISFSGIVTFKRSDTLRTVLAQIPTRRLLLETDAPYLAPVPMRGHPNIPSYLRYTAALVAEILNKNMTELDTIISSNFSELML